MGIGNWPLFKAGIFRKTKYFLSAPVNCQKNILCRENGQVSVPDLPMSIGFMSLNERMQSWLTPHQLKLKVQGFKEPLFLITERSYIPVDIYDKFKAADRASLIRLCEIAIQTYDRILATVVKQKVDLQSSFNSKVFMSGIVLIILATLISLVRC